MSGETIGTCSRDFDGSLSQCLVLKRPFAAGQSRCAKYHAGKRETHRNKTDKQRESPAILNEVSSLFVLSKYFFFALQHGGFVPRDRPPGKDPFKQLNSFNFT